LDFFAGEVFIAAAYLVAFGVLVNDLVLFFAWAAAIFGAAAYEWLGAPNTKESLDDGIASFFFFSD
jgi:hypothetical protein